MSVVAFASFKSSPGVTTTTMAAAHIWPGQRAPLVVEADPAGGDLAARYGRPADPGLASLAAAGRRSLTPELLARHTQILGGISVLSAPPTGPPAGTALETVGSFIGAALAGMGSDVLVDCGRLGASSPAVALARAADLVVVVARPTVVELPRVAAGAAWLIAEGATVGLALIGGPSSTRYPAAEVMEAVGVGVLATLADDAEGAALLGGSPGGPRSLDRSALVRSARDLVAALRAFPSGSLAHETGVQQRGELPPGLQARRAAAR